MKVALVHDFLVEYGGGERVLEALHEIFPYAPIYTPYFRLSGFGPHQSRIKQWNIKTSWMQILPKVFLSPCRIFAAKIFEGFDLSDYDLIISSCNTYFAKAVKVKPTALHISYIHTPPRYLYGYTTSFNYKKNPLTRVSGELANHYLRILDFKTSQRPNILIANSKEVQARIQKFYRRDSVVIYPPVSTVIPSEATPKAGDKKYFLSVGRLVRGKGIDVIVKAFTKLNLPLKVVGSGPEIKSLKFKVQSAKLKNIEFLGQVADDQLAGLYANAKATIMASEDEDFGIVPVESQALGTPVIAPRAGGFLETMIDGKTGMLYGGPGMVSAESLIEAIQRFNSSNNFKAEDCIKNAEKFSKEQFKKEILQLIDKHFKK